MALLRLPEGDLVFWDAHTGPRFHGTGLERAGCERVLERSRVLKRLLAVTQPLDTRPTRR